MIQCTSPKFAIAWKSTITLWLWSFLFWSSQYFNDIKVKHVRIREECTIECGFCDCTRIIKLPSKSLMHKESQMNKEVTNNGNVKEEDIICSFIEIGRVKMNRMKQRTGMQGVKILFFCCNFIYIKGG